MNIHHLPCLLIFVLPIDFAFSIQIKGSYHLNGDQIKPILRFGFGRSELNHLDETTGYVFGNVHVSFDDHIDQNKEDRRAVLILIPSDKFFSFYNDLVEFHHNSTCTKILESFDGDYINNTNCMISSMTIDYNTVFFIPNKYHPAYSSGPSFKKFGNSQFTFIVNLPEPRFYYLVILPCTLKNKSCSENINWTDNFKDTSLVEYNIYVVNGNPNVSNSFFTFHFSYEKQDLVLYLVMINAYLLLTFLQTYALVKNKQRNFLIYIFTFSLWMHFFAFLFITVHKLVFASNGVGCQPLETMSDIFSLISLTYYILFVIVIAKGWPITRNKITAKLFLFMMSLIYFISKVLLFVWTKKSVDVITDTDEFHTFPKWLDLAIRIVVMMWFLFELRATMMIEQNQEHLRFYLHFGAGIMVWFVHLPIVAFIGLQISYMWRMKLILGFSFAANFIAFAVITNFMWPSKSNYYFIHPKDADYSEELDYTDERPSESMGRLSSSNLRIINSNDTFAYDNHIKS